MCPVSLGTGLDGPREKGAGMAGWWLPLIPIECGRRSAPEQERSFFVHTLDHNQSRWKKRQRYCYTPAYIYNTA